MYLSYITVVVSWAFKRVYTDSFVLCDFTFKLK